MGITAKQIERLEYRKERLLSEARKLEYLLSGRNISLGPKLRGEDGSHSEEKTWDLIEQLIGALEKYEKYTKCDILDEGDVTMEEIDHAMPEEQKRFYRSFLYCALRVIEEGVVWPCEEWMPRSTFDSVLRLVEKTPFYMDKYELYFSELYEFTNGFFYYMDEAYHSLNGNSIVSTISQADREEVRKRYAYQVNDYEMGVSGREEEMENSGLSRKELAELERQAAEAEWSSLSESEQKENQDELRNYEEWKERFPEKERFCRQYELCRDLYFERLIRPQELAFQIERMMDVYLLEQGDSRFMDHDAFFYAFALLRRTVKQTRDLLLEGV